MIFERASCKDNNIIEVTDSLAPQNRLKTTVHVPLVGSRGCFRAHWHTFPEVRTAMGAESEILLSLGGHLNLPEPMDSVHSGEKGTTREGLEGLINPRKRHNIIPHSLIDASIVDGNPPTTVLFRNKKYRRRPLGLSRADNA